MLQRDQHEALCIQETKRKNKDIFICIYLSVYLENVCYGLKQCNKSWQNINFKIWEGSCEKLLDRLNLLWDFMKNPRRSPRLLMWCYWHAKIKSTELIQFDFHVTWPSEPRPMSKFIITPRKWETPFYLIQCIIHFQRFPFMEFFCFQWLQTPLQL